MKLLLTVFHEVLLGRLYVKMPNAASPLEMRIHRLGSVNYAIFYHFISAG